MKFAETVGVYLLRLYSSVVVCRNVIKFYRRVQYYSKNCMSIIYIYIYIYIYIKSVFKCYGLSCIS